MMNEWPVIWAEAFFSSCLVFFCISVLTTIALREIRLFPIAYSLFCLIMTIVMIVVEHVLNDRNEPE
jgi:hypothetical protein